MESDKLDDNTDPEEENNNNNKIEDDFSIDFTTSSAISSVGIKFLVLYIPIF